MYSTLHFLHVRTAHLSFWAAEFFSRLCLTLTTGVPNNLYKRWSVQYRCIYILKPILAYTILILVLTSVHVTKYKLLKWTETIALAESESRQIDDK